MTWEEEFDMLWCLPDEVVGAGSGCGMLGGGGERALVLFAQCIDGGVIVGGGGTASLGSRLSTDWLQTGAARIKEKKKEKSNYPDELLYHLHVIVLKHSYFFPQ